MLKVVAETVFSGKAGSAAARSGRVYPASMRQREFRTDIVDNIVTKYEEWVTSP